MRDRSFTYFAISPILFIVLLFKLSTTLHLNKVPILSSAWDGPLFTYFFAPPNSSILQQQWVILLLYTLIALYIGFLCNKIHKTKHFFFVPVIIALILLTLQPEYIAYTSYFIATFLLLLATSILLEKYKSKPHRDSLHQFFFIGFSIGILTYVYIPILLFSIPFLIYFILLIEVRNKFHLLLSYTAGILVPFYFVWISSYFFNFAPCNLHKLFHLFSSPAQFDLFTSSKISVSISIALLIIGSLSVIPKSMTFNDDIVKQCWIFTLLLVFSFIIGIHLSHWSEILFFAAPFASMLLGLFFWLNKNKPFVFFLLLLGLAGTFFL